MAVALDIAAMTAAMAWEILWPLILGFALSGVVQALVSQRQVSRLMPDDGAKSLATAMALGAASSSCSYAAVALARSLFRKGADFTAAIAFQVASTNLVLELAIILIVLMGWQFAAAEFAGAIVMVVVLALLFRIFLSKSLVAEARRQADKGLAGRMEGHAEMDMSVTGTGTLLSRLFSPRGITAVSHYFVMDWASVWTDIALGLILAGVLAVLVPGDVWRALFLVDHPVAAKIAGPLIGPVIAMLSFVCSVGNIPLAAVLWNGGISFGGVVAFIFADLLVLPILDIYRKYYGWKVMALLTAALYAAMAVAAFGVELAFGALGLIPASHHAKVIEAGFRWNYTSFLNIAFLALAALLLWRFLRTGGPQMLREMDHPSAHEHSHPHCH
ncbi:MAG TPA: permease [Rhizomicrobium sp.]|nr:permease [Rhizomicrobium sp.]